MASYTAGLDFLLDEKGNPLLLEINASPSLSLSSATSETTSSPTANPTTTTTTTNHPSSHFPPNGTSSIPQAGQEATGIEQTQALTEDPSNCEEQIQSSSQSVNSKVDESIKKPIVLESLLLACPQYQIIPTWQVQSLSKLIKKANIDHFSQNEIISSQNEILIQ